jgi:hypothetical protein
LERRRAEQHRQRVALIKRTSLWSGAVLALGLLVVVGIRTLAGQGGSQAQASQTPIPGIVTYSHLAQDHTTARVTYAQNPPVGGPHNPIWQNCGIYTSSIPNETAVHSLEHGAVWLTYRPDLSAAAVQTLQHLMQGRSYTLLSPYPGLPAPAVISAWGLQLRVQAVSDPRLVEFIARYADGPQAPEPGGECTGGVGTPLPTAG